MKQVSRRAVFALSAALMAALSFATLIAMVIAPACTGIMEKAGTYKIASLGVFLGGYYLLVWRRRSVIAAIALPVLQIVSGLVFASYLNSLPMACSQ